MSGLYVLTESLPFLCLGRGPMKLLNLLLWVTQFGVSILFPLCFFLMLAAWLQNRFGLGMWIYLVCGTIGFMTSVSTVRACLHSLLKAAEEASTPKEPPIAFNDHD